MKRSLRSCAFALLPFAIATVFAQTPPNPPKQDPPKTEAGKQDPPKPTPKPGDPKPYAEVITKEAVSQDGVFKVHRIADKVYWEIPESHYGREMLWQTEVAELPPLGPFSYPGTGVGTTIVKFERRNNRVFLRNVPFSMRTYANGGIRKGVEMNSVAPIIYDFAVEAEGEIGPSKAKSVVIDVTAMFTSDPADFTVRPVVGAAGVIPNRSYIDRVKAFPRNVETRSVLTMARGAQSAFSLFGGGGASPASTVTVTVHYSLVLLPDKPMMPRLKDSRIGYFTVDFTEYGRPEGKSQNTRYITRFRLEKKDPTAAISEPKEPIVFYLAREVPEKWRPYLKKGVEDWQVAFEQAGFKNAIIAKDAPTEKEDPNWDAEDARYSVIRWAPSPIANAMGPSIQDPRSGETISAHIIFWNDIIALLESWYFTQAAAIDPKTSRLPLPDDLMGELVRYVAAHEVGHTLGLEHNFKSSAFVSIPQLRDPKWTSENGVSQSIMDYSRFNYVAQPGDGVTQTIGKIGPYDKFAIEYGYKPLPNVATPDDEKSALDTLLAKQVLNPALRFGNYEYFQDATTQTEDIGDDAVEATRLGLLNLDRIATTRLLPTTTKFGEDYSALRDMVGELINQRFTELFHVVNNIGGIVETNYHAGRGGDVFRPVAAEKQRRAVQFLLGPGLQTPKGIFEPQIYNKINPDGLVGDVVALQSFLVTSMLQEDRLRRMYDAEAANPATAYKVSEMLSTVFNGIWSEVGTTNPRVDIYRRNLHRAFLRAIDRRINGPTATGTDMKLIAKAELKRLAQRIDKAIPAAGDSITAMHLQQCREDIGLIVNDKFTKAGASGGGSVFSILGLMGIEREKLRMLGCFTPWSKLPRAIQQEVTKELSGHSH